MSESTFNIERMRVRGVRRAELDYRRIARALIAYARYEDVDDLADVPKAEVLPLPVKLREPAEVQEAA